MMAAIANMEFGRQLEGTSSTMLPGQEYLKSVLSQRNSLGIQAALSEFDLSGRTWYPESQSISPSGMSGMEIAGRCMPMMDVSGDCFSFSSMDGGQIGMAIGDACGKGMEAARLMASVCTIFQMLARKLSVPGKLLYHLNRVVCHSTPQNQFVTFLYGLWNADAHTFTYSRAGHPPALHYKSATKHVHELSVGGMVLGVCEDMKYPTASVSLDIGDVLVLYTDGITEATDVSSEVFGSQRLAEVVMEYGDKPSEVLVSEILNAVSRFAHQRWTDDVTLVIVKRANV
jgi:sigma-B regulation protein RsbU (phosphoserine phosphatase)